MFCEALKSQLFCMQKINRRKQILSYFIYKLLAYDYVVYHSGNIYNKNNI